MGEAAFIEVTHSSDQENVSARGCTNGGLSGAKEVFYVKECVTETGESK